MTFLPARVHELHPGPMKGLDVSARGIATGGSDGVVRLLAGNGEHIGSSDSHSDLVNAVALDATGRVVSGSRDRTLRVFDPSLPRSYVVGEHEKWVMSVSWSDDGSRIVSGSEDGTIAIWDPDGAEVRRFDLGYPTNAVHWRGDVIAAASGNRILYLLDGDGAMRRELPGAEQMLWSTALSPDARLVAWTGRDRYLRIAPVDGGDALVVPAHRDQVWSVAWDESGDRLVTGSADGTAAVWSPRGEALERITTPSWVRRAMFRGEELYLATETGDLRIYSDDRIDAATPDPVIVPTAPDRCSHWDPQVEKTPLQRCQECGSVEELRLCVTCGHVGCCESQLAHGTKHWLESRHPNTVPVAPGPYRWRWCYADDMYVRRTE